MPAPAGAGPEEAWLLAALATLVDKSLLRQEPDAAATGRLHMLETIREYALEQLAASGEAAAVRRAHALYFVALGERAEATMTGPDQVAWLDRLEQEHDNLRAALTWAAESANPALGAQLAAALWEFWLLRGYISEGRRWLDAFLAEDGGWPAALRGRVLNGGGPARPAPGRLCRRGDAAPGEPGPAAGAAPTRKGEMEVLDNLGLAAIYQDDLGRAQRYFEQSLSGWRALGDQQGMTTALNRLGLTLRYQGDFPGAARLFEECLALARQLPGHLLYRRRAAQPGPDGAPPGQ